MGTHPKQGTVDGAPVVFDEESFSPTFRTPEGHEGFYVDHQGGSVRNVRSLDDLEEGFDVRTLVPGQKG